MVTVADGSKRIPIYSYLSRMSTSLHLVDNGGELMLAHRTVRSTQRAARYSLRSRKSMRGLPGGFWREGFGSGQRIARAGRPCSWAIVGPSLFCLQMVSLCHFDEKRAEEEKKGKKRGLPASDHPSAAPPVAVAASASVSARGRRLRPCTPSTSPPTSLLGLYRGFASPHLTVVPCCPRPTAVTPPSYIQEIWWVK
uniref:Uncharacterized protein n=1 Tax=Leersia perrieri TaxID=77586 RepID=A0A0D9XMM3_9ORYZ